MSHHYCRNWHQCHRCGCTYPDHQLRKLQLVDDVLKVTSDVHQCTDAARCERFGKERRAILAREAGLSLEAPGVRRRRK